MDLIKITELCKVIGYSRNYIRRICSENGIETKLISGKTNLSISQFFDAANKMGLIFPAIRKNPEYIKDHGQLKKLTDKCLKDANSRIGVINIDQVKNDSKEILTLIQARTEKERWLAKMARLKYLEANSKLVTKIDVKRAWVKIALRVRSGMLLIPGRLAVSLCESTDHFEIEEMLVKEIEATLVSLNEGGEDGIS